MKKNILKIALALALVCAVALGAVVTAEQSAQTFSEPASDPSPALYVSQKNLYSVVGVITGTRLYDRYTGEPQMDTSAQGSGVVIAEGGYVLTNYHVIENGSDYQILLSDGTKVDAVVQGSDSEMDLAVLKVENSEDAAMLVPVEIGSSHDLPVGSTVVAIGNPGGEILAHSVTQGIVSALERSSVSSQNTSVDVDYIQHDAPISSGNSGGGLFDYKGRLVGINTLKYGGNSSIYSNSVYEGLGFAIPIESAYPIAQQLIERGKVVRPQLGVTVSDYNGGDEPEDNQPPKSVCVTQVNDGGPAERAGMQAYDFIYSINGQRVTTTRELKTALDDHSEGDTVTVTVVRYNNVQQPQQNYNNYGNNGGNYYMSPFDYFFGNYGYGNYGNNYGYNYGQNQQGNQQSGGMQFSGGYQFIDLQITLELPEEQ